MPCELVRVKSSTVLPSGVFPKTSFLTMGAPCAEDETPDPMTKGVKVRHIRNNRTIRLIIWVPLRLDSIRLDWKRFSVISQRCLKESAARDFPRSVALSQV